MPYKASEKYIDIHNFSVFWRPAAEKIDFSASKFVSEVKTQLEAITTLQEIGPCEEKPKLDGSEGDSINLSGGQKKVLNKKFALEISDVAVSGANTDWLEDNVCGVKGDFILFAEDTGKIVGIYDQLPIVLPGTEGNGISKNTIKAETTAKKRKNFVKEIEFFLGDGSIAEIEIVNGGSGYEVDDAITIAGNGSAATGKVVTVDESGKITSVEITAAGSKYFPDETTTAIVSSSAGSGAVMKVITDSY